MRARDFVYLGIIALLLAAGIFGFYYFGARLQSALDDNRLLKDGIANYQKQLAEIQSGLGSIVTGIKPITTGLGEDEQRVEGVIGNLGSARAILERSRKLE